MSAISKVMREESRARGEAERSSAVELSDFAFASLDNLASAAMSAARSKQDRKQVLHDFGVLQLALTMKEHSRV